MLKPRPQVAVFAAAMEEILKTKDYRGKFLDEVRPMFALDRIFEEVRELDREAYSELHKQVVTEEKLRKIQSEAVDVANFAAMIWWACEKIRGSKSKHASLFGDAVRVAMEFNGKPMYVQCPVCGSDDTLNKNPKANVPLDLCKKCHTDLHSDCVFNDQKPCPYGCGQKYCFCEARASWKREQGDRKKS